LNINVNGGARPSADVKVINLRILDRTFLLALFYSRAKC